MTLNPRQDLSVTRTIIVGTGARQRQNRGSIVIGAFAGDIIGQPYEGMRHNIRTTEFPLFLARSHFTDDSVLTAAVADAILSGEPYGAKLKEYFGYYPHAGYGGAFKHWARSGATEPYNSFGNGSAMRVGPVGWAFDSIEEVLEQAKQSAEVTHNHPEGIKGAQAIAVAVFLARTGHGKEEIREFLQDRFGYDLSESIDSLRTWYALDYDPLYISCMKSVPPALIAFLDSDSFEDAIRKVISIGGDSDTLACITGGIAEAHYGVPTAIRDEVLSRLDERLSMVLIQFEDRFVKPQ
jgi:ADP-ribosylglycohydrolase